jgi:hypothetical protein
MTALRHTPELLQHQSLLLTIVLVSATSPLLLTHMLSVPVISQPVSVPETKVKDRRRSSRKAEALHR